MKKNKIKGYIVIAISAYLALNLNITFNKNGINKLTLENIEALAVDTDEEYCLKQWTKYHRPDGTGYNCTKGGIESCFC